MNDAADALMFGAICFGIGALNGERGRGFVGFLWLIGAMVWFVTALLRTLEAA